MLDRRQLASSTRSTPRRTGRARGYSTTAGAATGAAAGAAAGTACEGGVRCIRPGLRSTPTSRSDPRLVDRDALGDGQGRPHRAAAHEKAWLATSSSRPASAQAAPLHDRMSVTPFGPHPSMAAAYATRSAASSPHPPRAQVPPSKSLCSEPGGALALSSDGMPMAAGQLVSALPLAGSASGALTIGGASRTRRQASAEHLVAGHGRPSRLTGGAPIRRPASAAAKLGPTACQCKQRACESVSPPPRRWRRLHMWHKPGHTGAVADVAWRGPACRRQCAHGRWRRSRSGDGRAGCAAGGIYGRRTRRRPPVGRDALRILSCIERRRNSTAAGCRRTCISVSRLYSGV